MMSQVAQAGQDVRGELAVATDLREVERAAWSFPA
jgi:hypothetical protein